MNCSIPFRSGSVRHGLAGLSPQTCHLAPTVKHAGQESGGELCEIFKMSKSVNNVCELLQLLGDFASQTPTGASPLDPNGGLPSLRLRGL